ncbi:MAG TPA: PKD domain-containing protein [Vicingus sp.]|nr:PKD domain-containing protein [Vicingus sp.]
MKNQLLIIMLTLTMSLTYGQNLKWVKGIEHFINDEGVSVTTDNLGNVYITGNFQGTADFNPGVGVYNLTSLGFDDNIFILKLDSNGSFVWAKNIEVNFLDPLGGEKRKSIVVDNLGNVYITANFLGTVDFDPGAGVYNLTDVGSGDIFILKLDSNGDFVWAKQMGANYGDYGYSIAVDNLGNVYTTGAFHLTVDFDPGPGTFNLSATGGSSGGTDIFILKLSSSGSFVWAKRIGGIDNDGGCSITIDDFGNVYTTGSFTGNVDFDPGTGTSTLFSAGEGDVFISKLNSAGNFLWAKRMGGIDDGDGAYSITTDNIGNVYTTGVFYNTVDFDPGTSTYNLTSQGWEDIFISKLDANGNFVWAKSMGGTSWDMGYSIAIDNSGNVYTSGSFMGNVDFDPGIGTFNFNSGGFTHTFISKLDANGTFMWAYNMGGANINSLTIDNSDNIVTTGWYMDNVDFDPDTSTYYLSPTAGGRAIFVHKMGGCSNSSNYTYINNGNGNYTFNNNSTGNFNQSHWAFGDGFTTTVANPNHTFSANGTYVVVLTVHGSIGGSCMDYYLDTIVVTGVVAPLQCAAGFVMYPDAGGVTVVNSSTGTNLTYFWNFGDGDTSTLQTPTHTYAVSGPYYLCLTIDDGAGCVDMYCDSIGENGVVFNKQNGFTINIIAPPLVTQVSEQEILISSMAIYPNPTGSVLNVVFKQNELYQLQITAIDGKIIEAKTINGNTTVDVSKYSSGMYFITATNKEGKVFQSKFVKE